VILYVKVIFHPSQFVTSLIVKFIVFVTLFLCSMIQARVGRINISSFVTQLISFGVFIINILCSNFPSLNYQIIKIEFESAPSFVISTKKYNPLT
jgi:hypothetical protein